MVVHAKTVLTSKGDSLEDQVPKNNFTAVTDPGPSDDETDDYSVGSGWTNVVLGKTFECVNPAEDNADWRQTNASGGASLGATWSFDEETGDADPGSKKFRLNNATQGSATYIYVSDTAESGVDMRTLLLLLSDGDRIYMQQEKDSSRYHLFKVTGAAEGATDYVKLPVAADTSGSSIEDGKKCPWLIIFSGSGAAASVFGNSYNYQNEDAVDGTTEQVTYQTAFTATQLTNLPAGTYLIRFTAELGQSDKQKPYRWRYQHQIDTEGWVTCNPDNEDVPPYTDATYKVQGTFCQVTLTEGQDLQCRFQYRATGAGGTAYMRNKRVTVWRTG